MKDTIIEALTKNKNKISFHTPGHNNTLPKQIIKYDITELEYSDNLLYAKGALKDLQQKVSHIYNVKRAFLSTNGATNCIQTAIYATKHKGGFLIVGNAHSSVYNTLRLLSDKAYYIESLDDTTTLPDDVGTLIITSPNYYGQCLDLEYYKKLAKRQNLILIIDASHGSHFAFSNKLPISATLYGDLVIHSLHKTLPVATGGAALLCNNTDLIAKSDLGRNLFHSTSPSYITLASIDRAFSIMAESGEKLYDKVYFAIKTFKESNLGKFKCLQNNDFSRLVLYSEFDAKQVLQKLLNMGLALEMSCENKVVAIVTPYNYKHLQKLAKALRIVSQCHIPLFKSYGNSKFNDRKIKELIFNKQKEYINLDDAEGRISFREIGLYPPGVPLVKSGEIITKQVIQTLKENEDNCFGLEKHTVAVISYNDGGKR